jgi:hypothetical protein
MGTGLKPGIMRGYDRPLCVKRTHLTAYSGGFLRINVQIYAVWDNPLKYTDPDGNFVISSTILISYGISSGLAAAYGLWSLYRMDHPGGVPLQRGHGLTIPKGWQAFRDWDGQWKYQDRRGNTYDQYQNPWDIESQNGNLTENNFRNNLKKYTGSFGLGKDAHHIFPQNKAFRKYFEDAGIDINHPKYGSWWDNREHRSKSFEYNQRWANYFQSNPEATKEEILEFGRSLADEYNLDINY